MCDGYRPWNKVGIIIHSAVRVCDGIAAMVQDSYQIFASHYGGQGERRAHTNEFRHTEKYMIASGEEKKKNEGLDLKFDSIMGWICMHVGYICVRAMDLSPARTPT